MEKKKILLVDDSPNMTQMLHHMLNITGDYHIQEENKGRRALATAREFNPDLMFLDFMMPDVDGIEVAAQFEEDENLKHTKIVFLTAIVTKDEVDSGSVDNISGYSVLAKPVRANELTACIDNLLGP